MLQPVFSFPGSQRKEPRQAELFSLVTLRGSNWNTYWGGFVHLSEQLEEQGIGEEAEADDV